MKIYPLFHQHVWKLPRYHGIPFEKEERYYAWENYAWLNWISLQGIVGIFLFHLTFFWSRV
jgi:hypothetical protein